MAKYVDVTDVPLMRVGTWDASTGKESVTRADLDAIVEAFNSGELDPAVIKIGHTDPRFDNPDYDGDPAYGRVVNLRVTDDKGGILYGDYEAVPEELAEKLDSAYPYRSVEIAKDVELLDADGKVTATFARVLVGLALLGSSAPAVKGLGAVHANLSQRVRPATTSVFSTGQFSLQGGLTTGQLRTAIQAALQEAYRTSGSDWVDVWLEDFDDTLAWYHYDAGMFQSTYTIDEAGRATLTGDPVPVKERRVFEPVTSDTGNVPRSFAESTQPDKERPAGANDNHKETATMALNEKQLARGRKVFGLPDDATEADVLAAMEADEPDAHENPGTGNPPAGTTPGDGTGSQPTPPATVTNLPTAPTTPPVIHDQVAAAGATEPTASVVVSAAQFAELTQTNAKLAADLKEIKDREDKVRRDGIVSAAFAAGKLHKDEVADWRSALDDNEGVTVALLSKRVAVFPVAEIGHDAAPAAFSLNPGTVSEKELAADDALFNIGKDAK